MLTTITNCIFTNTSSTNASLYFTTGASGTTNATLGNDVEVFRSAPPLRIAQRQKMRAHPMSGDEMIKAVDVGIIEIPSHRSGHLKWFDVEPNTLLELPDGTIIDVEDRYRFKVYEDNARVTREACRIQAFNRFLNASEMLEAFIKDMAPAGIRQDQVLKVPVEAFINWLVYKAANADGESVPMNRYNHRCSYCKRYISRRLVSMGVNFCNAIHLDKYLQSSRLLLAAPN